MKYIFRVGFLLVLSLCFLGNVFAKGEVSFEDNVIGSSFKTLAKAFVATADIEKIKKDNIAKLNKMEEKKFNKRYAKIYEDIKELPASLKSSYGIVESMPREQVIKVIEALNKKKIYELIDLIPNAVIAKRFKKEITAASAQKSNLSEEVGKFWNMIVNKINKPVRA